MFERLLLAIALITAGGFGWIAFNRFSVRRLAHLTAGANSAMPIDPILSGLTAGIPTIVYFTTPFCEPCRTLQRPTLTRLQGELGANAIQIVQIDATEQPDAADRWGVFSAPTTFILDAAWTPRGVNRGVASLETLKRQITDVRPAPSVAAERPALKSKRI
jgi:thiol-disulfide isomerase/thioredoxin